MNSLKYLLERRLFGVCDTLGSTLKISSSRIRLYFIYTSFLTMGSPVLLYLIMAFWLNLKQEHFGKRRSLLDL